MDTSLHRNKLINAVLYFAKNTRYLGKTKLMKLLFFLDFKHFQETAKSVTNLEYFAWERGPVPKDFFFELSNSNQPEDLKKVINVCKVADDSDFRAIIAKGKPDLRYFSKREFRILSEIAETYRDVKADDISEISHLENEPWDQTLRQKGDNHHIDYLLAIDNKKRSLPFEVAKERHQMNQQMKLIFGTV